MRVAFIITQSDPVGGAQIHVRDLSRQLKADGCDVHVITGNRGQISRELEELGIVIHVVDAMERRIKPTLDLKAIFQVRSVLKSIGPAIVSTHSSKAGLIGRIASWGLGSPVLFTAHGWAFTAGVQFSKRLMYAALEKLGSFFCHRVITVSNYDKEIALKWKVVSADKILTIHNGMPAGSEFPHAVPTQSHARLISVARFDEQKDHETLLYALADIRDLNWHLRLVGGGPLRSEIEKLVTRLNLNNRVTFLGQRFDVPALLAESDIFLLISNWEGFPRSILEAMRAGLPVIASNVGGVSEAVKESDTGYLVERGDAVALRDHLHQLIMFPDFRSELGTRGRATFEQKFMFDRMYLRTRQLYDDLTASSRDDGRSNN